MADAAVMEGAVVGQGAVGCVGVSSVLLYCCGGNGRLMLGKGLAPRFDSTARAKGRRRGSWQSLSLGKDELRVECCSATNRDKVGFRRDRVAGAVITSSTGALPSIV